MTAAHSDILVLTRSAEDAERLRLAMDHDHPVRVCGEAGAFIEAAGTEPPQLLLLDAALPDSEAVLEWSLREPGLADRPVLILTAPGGLDAALALVARGARDVLERPLDLRLVKVRLGNALALGQHQRLLRRIVALDPVTGLGNRLRFDEYMDLEWRRNLRNHTDLSLVLLDLDHFRTFEGRYGRGATDEALLRVGQALEGCILRAGDLVSRQEGGKFAVVLPETDTIGAVAVAERMRAEVAALGIPHEDSRTEPTLTVSAGVSARTPESPEGLSDFLAEAERRLTQAKARGRNQVVFG